MHKTSEKKCRCPFFCGPARWSLKLWLTSWTRRERLGEREHGGGKVNFYTNSQDFHIYPAACFFGFTDLFDM